MFRYVIAIAVAVLVIAAGGFFCLHTRTQFESRFREALKAAKEAGQLPPEWENADLDEIDAVDFGMECSASDKLRLSLSEILARHRFVLSTLVVGTCLAIAALTKRP